jgi:hypothetical protein
VHRKFLMPTNYPFRVNFAGLTGDLASLQSQGWELSIDQTEDPGRDSIGFRVAGRHKNLNLQIISATLYLERHWVMKSILDNRVTEYFRHLEIAISFIAPRVDMVVYGKPNFRAVDFMEFGMRELDMDNVQRFNLEDLGVFRTFGKETELFVPEKKIIDVQEYLKDILVSQEDKQKEIRQRMLREGEKFNLRNELEQAPKLRLVGY